MTTLSLSALEKDGYCLLRDVLSRKELELLRDETDRLNDRQRAGTRNLMALSACFAELAHASRLKTIANEALGTRSFPVRALLFDKQPRANWKVPWHQDTAIAVRERVEAPGFTGWSVKDGVPHVHPPAHLLEAMVTLRLHLDDCGPENGPLRVISGSHTEGILDSGQIEAIRGRAPEAACCAMAGDLLVMRPLLLHASSPAGAPSHRRVIHLEYASNDLPCGLEWYEHESPISHLN